MPRTALQGFHLPVCPVPAVRSYLTFSSFLFCSGFYYYYVILRDSYNDFWPDGGSFSGEALNQVFDKFPLLFYILLNTFLACIVFLGRVLTRIFIGTTTPQEDTTLKTVYSTFLRSKLAYLLFMSTNFFDDTLALTPWFFCVLVAVTLLELMSSRILSNAQQNVSSSVIFAKYVTASTLCATFASVSFAYLVFFHEQKRFLDWKTIMVADCISLTIDSINIFHKLASLSRVVPDGFSHYFGIMHTIVTDSVSFYISYYVYIHSRNFLFVSCVVMVLEMLSVVRTLMDTLRKHIRYQRVVNHIKRCYPQASKADLIDRSCAICWEPMESARRLPCGHCFHESCLCRWLQQDSSCAVCRTPLPLYLSQIFRNNQNNVVLPEDDIDVLAIFRQELLRLITWLHRGQFPRAHQLTPSEEDNMVGHILTIFPQYSRQVVRNAVRMTGTVELAVGMLMENENLAMGGGDAMAVRLDEESENDENVDTTGGRQQDQPQQQQQDFGGDHLDDAGAGEKALEDNDTWFSQQKRRIIEECRRKYLASERAADLIASELKKDL